MGSGVLGGSVTAWGCRGGQGVSVGAWVCQGVLGGVSRCLGGAESIPGGSLRACGGERSWGWCWRFQTGISWLSTGRAGPWWGCGWEGSLKEGNHGVFWNSETPLLPRKHEEMGSEGFWVLGAVPCLCHLPILTEGCQLCCALRGFLQNLRRPQGRCSGAPGMQKGTFNPPSLQECPASPQDSPPLSSGMGRSSSAWLLGKLPNVGFQ